MKFEEAMMRLRSSAEFQIVMPELEKHRPTLMCMSPTKDIQQEAARLMFESGEQYGFDKLMALLRGKHDPRS